MSNRRSALLPLLIGLLMAPWAALGQNVQSPDDFLGYELGSRFTMHHAVVSYVNYVGEASPRVLVRPYGETYEGRPLIAAIVTSERNHARLESIRRDNLRLAGLEDGELEGTPLAIVWLSYNVHGNESVSTEAAMKTLHALATASGDMEAWLEKTVVIIDPCINPDGRDRYTSWYNQTVGRFPNANPDAIEHREPWPGGRANHYLFDLNRDWTWQTQKESRERIAWMQTWMPHVHVDFHEQGVNSPYYFAPAAEPYHPLISDWQRAFQDSIGTNHARYFDQNGWLYYTGEVYDLFYPGFGDTFPSFNGAIGVTYEQGGSGRAGLGIETAEGDTLTLADRIAHHHTTGLSTIETTARQADRVISEFEAYFDQALTTPAGDWATFVVRASSGLARLRAIAEQLDRLGIEYGTVSAARRVSGEDYRTRNRSSETAEPGDLVVSALQPRGALATVMLEPEGELLDSLTYDITSWSLPYVYGADGFATSDRVVPDAVLEIPAPETAPDLGEAASYLVRWDSRASAEFLADALSKGMRPRVATRPFTTQGESYSPGTLIFTPAGNNMTGASLGDGLRRSAESAGVQLISVRSGRVESGSDFGSNSVRFLDTPEVLLIAGEGTSSLSAGAAWYYFDHVLSYPVTRVAASGLFSVDLSSYDVVVLASGRYRLSEGQRDELLSYARGGGRVVAVGGAVGAIASIDAVGLKVRTTEEADLPEDTLKVYGDRTREALRDDVPGAFFTATVDTTHPLGFGLGRGYYLLKQTGTAYEYMTGRGAWNVGTIQDGSRLSGHIGHEAEAKLYDSLAFGVRELGAGEIVVLPDDPFFRGFLYDSHLLVANAVFMPLR